MAGGGQPLGPGKEGKGPRGRGRSPRPAGRRWRRCGCRDPQFRGPDRERTCRAMMPVARVSMLKVKAGLSAERGWLTAPQSFLLEMSETGKASSGGI